MRVSHQTPSKSERKRANRLNLERNPATLSLKYEIRACQRFLRFLCSFAFVLWCFTVFAPAVLAATSLSGNVTDPQGSVVVGATVRLLRRGDSSRRGTQTDSQGQFIFLNVDPGEYCLTAEYPGFAPISRTVAVSDANASEDIQFSSI